MVTSGCGPENGKKVLTMAEYINREAAIRALLNDSPEQVGYSRENAADCIRFMDAADVAPVRHGRWLHRKNGVAYCSECEVDTVEDETNYCPNCGATMDLED